jgi:hypothetical protein
MQTSQVQPLSLIQRPESRQEESTDSVQHTETAGQAAPASPPLAWWLDLDNCTFAVDLCLLPGCLVGMVYN